MAPPRGLAISAASEHEYLVCLSRPRGQCFHGAALGTLDEFAVPDPARVHAGRTHADLSAVLAHRLEHHLDVVVPLRELLVAVSARRSFADQENTHVLAFSL